MIESHLSKSKQNRNNTTYQKIGLFSENIFPWILSLSCVLLAIYHGGYSYITVDTLHNIEISRRMLGGEVAYRDFFEVNHPMSTYIVWIGVYLSSKILWLHDVSAVKLVICFFGFLSVILTWRVIRITDEYHNKYFRPVFIVMLWYVVFLLPMQFTTAELGQKTHLFFIFFLPYLHSFLLTDTQRKQYPVLMFIVGIWAGIGLCVKIYYFATAIILEFVRMLNKKSFRSVFRIETIAISIVSISFLLSIFIFTPEYITDVIPIAQVAYSGMAKDHSSLWILSIVYFLPHYIFLILFTSKQLESSKYYSLMKIAIIGSLITILIQVSRWEHAFLPMFGMIMLLTTVIIANILQNTIENFPQGKGIQFSPQYLSQILWVIVTILLIIQSLITNISQRPSKHFQYRQNYNIPYFIELSKKYGDKGGAIFLTESYEPQLYTWIYGEFSLQSYFYGMYLVDGIESAKKRYGGRKSPEWIKQKTGWAEQEIRDHIIDDIDQQKPAVIVLEKGSRVQYMNSEEYYTLPRTVDYLEFLNKNKKFQTIWQRYRLKEEISSTSEKRQYMPPVFEVYIRKDL